jgi:dTMP kinase
VKPPRADHRLLAGRFIVLEGIDGAGTTTQAARLVAALASAGVRAMTTREPSGGPWGVRLRELLGGGGDAVSRSWEILALLFAADRLDHVAREIQPALDAGICVVSDRYDLSSLVYQSATAPEGEDPVPWIRALNQRARRPDLTLVLDVAPEIAEARRAARGGPIEIFEKRELQRRLAVLYSKAEQFAPGDRILHVRGDGSVGEVEAAIFAGSIGALAGGPTTC